MSEQDRRRHLNAFANLPVLASAGAESLEQLLAETSFKAVPRGRRFCRQGEAGEVFFVLLEGVARVFQADADGNEFTVKIFRAPAHFGELSALSGLHTHASSVEAMLPCVAATVTHAALEQALRMDPALCRAWLYNLAHNHAVTIHLHTQNVFGGLMARAVNVLLSYTEVFGAEGADKRFELVLPLSYADISRQLGCSRRSAIRTMQELERLGAASREGERWSVDRAMLQKLVEPESLRLWVSNREDV
jgi:CRP-like cAMP-binding protein